MRRLQGLCLAVWLFSEGYCPQAERYYEEAISLPIYPALTEEKLNAVVTALKVSLKLT